MYYGFAMKILRIFKFWKLPKKVWIPGIIILLIVLYLVFKPQTPKEQPQIVQVKREDVQSKISGSGTLTGQDSVSLKFLGGGKLAYINVNEGDRVKKGQTIAGLDTQALSIQLQQAQNNLRSAQAAVEKTVDDTHLFQYGNGGFGNVGTANETETQKNNRTAAEVARDNAVESVNSAQRAFQDAVLTAPIAGLITQASPLAGQPISAADTVAQIVDDSSIYFDAEIDESDIGQIKQGMWAAVVLDAASDKTLWGQVEKIIPQIKTTSSGATVVIVRINLGKPDVTFVNGLSGQTDVITEEHKNVLAIPQDAIREDGTVYVKNGTEYQTVKIETGLTSDSDIEVKSGLSEGQQIVKNPASVVPPSRNPITRLIQSLTQKK